jgi:hypothetical protein
LKPGITVTRGDEKDQNALMNECDGLETVLLQELSGVGIVNACVKLLLKFIAIGLCRAIF